MPFIARLSLFLFLTIKYIACKKKTWGIFVCPRRLVYLLPWHPASWVLCWKGSWKHCLHDNMEKTQRCIWKEHITAESLIETLSTSWQCNDEYIRETYRNSERYLWIIYFASYWFGKWKFLDFKWEKKYNYFKIFFIQHPSPSVWTTVSDSFQRQAKPSSRETSCWASVEDASGTFPLTGVPGMSNWVKVPGVRPRILWRDYKSRLGWESLGVLHEALKSVAGEKTAWNNPVKAAATQSQISWRKWTDKKPKW